VPRVVGNNASLGRLPSATSRDGQRYTPRALQEIRTLIGRWSGVFNSPITGRTCRPQFTSFFACDGARRRRLIGRSLRRFSRMNFLKGTKLAVFIPYQPQRLRKLKAPRLTLRDFIFSRPMAGSYGGAYHIDVRQIVGRFHDGQSRYLTEVRFSLEISPS